MQRCGVTEGMTHLGNGSKFRAATWEDVLGKQMAGGAGEVSSSCKKLLVLS